MIKKSKTMNKDTSDSRMKDKLMSMFQSKNTIILEKVEKTQLRKQKIVK